MACELKVTCDRCRQLIVSGRSALKVECGPLLSHRSAIDLCLGCADDFAGFLGAFTTELHADRPPEVAGGSAA